MALIGGRNQVASVRFIKWGRSIFSDVPSSLDEVYDDYDVLDSTEENGASTWLEDKSRPMFLLFSFIW